MTPILEVRDLRKEFRLHILNGKRIAALEEVSFSMMHGEILGLVGKSGSGKSTLMKCLYRSYLASGGSILYDSRRYGVVDLATIGEHRMLRLRREEMTYCSQFLSVIPRVPAVEVVADKLVERGVPEDEALERSRRHLEDLGLPPELWDAFPSTFSGGEQQRVNVAQAIVARPRFLLIDEPTASLDRRAKEIVIGKILDLKRAGSSVILITHDADTLEAMADRQLRLVDGRLQELASA